MSKLNQVINGLERFNNDPEVSALIQNLKTLGNMDSYPSYEFMDNLRYLANALITKNNTGQNNELLLLTLPVLEILSEFKPEEDSITKIGMPRYGFFSGLPLGMLARTEFNKQAFINIGFGPQRSEEVAETFFLANAIVQASHCKIKL